MSCLVASRGDCGFWGVTMSSREAASGHRRKAGARYTPMPGARSVESLESIQHSDHHCRTP
jgi:hypothetical protein